jgi:hypothetical protein
VRTWLVLVLLVACGDKSPAKVDSPLGPDACSDDITSDPMNCGGCGVVCMAGNVCVDSECQVPCDATMLMSAKTDPWGIQWDGLERGPLALDAAAAACQAFGARLPTPTEMYRVSATQTGAVGMSFNTNPLWSAAPDDKLDQATLKLSDGTTTSTAAATATHFRCVCPAALPKTFSGGRCNGTPGAECFTLGKYNIDSKDRPSLRKGAQVWECTFEHGHVIDSSLLIEGIRSGLPGAGVDISTADMGTYYQAVGVQWSSSTWTTTGNLTAPDIRLSSPFRCAGLDVAVTPNPNTIPNQFVGPLSVYKGETADNALASWAVAHDTCFVRGGHLPRAAELAELVQQGLPAGSGVNLWTSDQVGFNGTQFLAEVLSWDALDQRFSFFYGGVDSTVTWDYKTAPGLSHAYRCIYYPIDTTYVAPTDCTGGCFMTAGGGSPAPTMWFDSMDRPAKNLSDATFDCAGAGARLASERDLTEAIRAGLPGGTAPGYVLTSDFAFGCSTACPNVYYATVARWTGVQPAFDDEYGTYMTWADPATARPYRCMWTNELR